MSKSIVKLENGVPTGQPQGIPSVYADMTNPRPEDMQLRGWAEYVAPDYNQDTHKLGGYIAAAMGAWTHEVVPLSAEEIDNILEVYKTEKLAEINSAYTDAMLAMTAGYPQAEIDTFPTQQKEAETWLADNNSPTPLISGIAGQRGLFVAEMVAKVIENVGLFTAGAGAYTGKRQLLRDQIKAATTVAEVKSITW